MNMLIAEPSLKWRRIYRATLLIFLVGLPVYCFSYYIFSNFIPADSLFYSRFWDFSRVTMSIDQIYNSEHGFLGSSDAGYALIIGLAAHLPFGRYEFLSFLNSIAAVSAVYAYLRRWYLLPVFYLLIFLGYYLPVLFIAPERLRFASFLLLFSFLTGSILVRISLIVLAILTHSQISLLVLGLYVYLYYDDLRYAFGKIFKMKISKPAISLAFLSALFLGCIIILNPHVMHKVAEYGSTNYNWKLILAPVLIFSAYLLGLIGHALFFSLATVFLVSIIALHSYLDRSLIVMYIIYLVDFLGVSSHKPKRYFLFLLVLCWTTWKSIMFYLSLARGGGGFDF